MRGSSSSVGAHAEQDADMIIPQHACCVAEAKLCMPHPCCATCVASGSVLLGKESSLAHALNPDRAETGAGAAYTSMTAAQDTIRNVLPLGDQGRSIILVVMANEHPTHTAAGSGLHQLQALGRGAVQDAVELAADAADLLVPLQQLLAAGVEAQEAVHLVDRALRRFFVCSQVHCH